MSKEIMRNFHTACGSISRFLHAQRAKASRTGAFGASGRALGQVIEHGLMFTAARTSLREDSLADLTLDEVFEADADTSIAVVSYWVVGRLLGGTKSGDGSANEVYVCFEDGCPVDTVEYAFQIDWQT